MSALILAVLLGQSIQITVRVVKPMCVVVDASGETRLVERRALQAGDRATGCAPTPRGSAPRVRQHVEAVATSGEPERRVIEIAY